MRHQQFSSDSLSIPKISSIGFAEDPLVTCCDAIQRNQYIIHYVLAGEGTFDGVAVHAKEGFLIRPMDKKEYRASPNDPWSFLWIISTDDAMEEFFTLHGADPKTNIFRFSNSYILDEIAKQLSATRETISSTVRLTETFLRIFNGCISLPQASMQPLPNVYFEFSVNYIHANLHLPLSVSQLCDALGITQPYLYRIFMQKAGISPKRYISLCRVEQAKKLLRETDLSVSFIASSVGFSNALDFSKFFSKNASLSPVQYRASLDKNQKNPSL